MISRSALFLFAIMALLQVAFFGTAVAKTAAKKTNKQIASERILGSHKQLLKAYNGLELDKKSNKLVLSIIKRLRKTASFRKKTVIPVILKSPQINALSLSSDAQNAYIYVTNGMLDFVENDDELAFILAHEMAHITLKSLTKLFDKQRKAHELKADLLGTKYMTIAGFDKKFAIVFIKRLNEIQKNQIGKNAHIYPSNQQRLKQLNNYK